MIPKEAREALRGLENMSMDILRMRKELSELRKDLAKQNDILADLTETMKQLADMYRKVNCDTMIDNLEEKSNGKEE